MFEQFIGTKPVEERHRIDLASLEKFLGMKISRIEQFKGGQSNPTYRFTEASGKEFVLRRKPPGKLLPSAHAVEREYRVIKALSERQFPVARPHVLCEDESVIGTAFYVMDYVCLLYTSDAADERSSVDLGGRRIIKKKNQP